MFRPGYVKPYEGESISHYLGRWRRYEVNSLSSAGGLGRFAGIGSVTARWEKFRFYHFPTAEELEAVSKVMEMDVEELIATLPTKYQSMKLEPIRLCAACYSDRIYHKSPKIWNELINRRQLTSQGAKARLELAGKISKPILKR
jgi:hypothetical protein